MISIAHLCWAPAVRDCDHLAEGVRAEQALKPKKNQNNS
jgi:hypothetical protein